MKKFKDFIILKEENQNDKILLEKGFIPPSKMRPVVRAFINSKTVPLIQDTSKEITLPKKTLYLTGGSVRDFIKNKPIKNYNLVTNATPEQIALILHHAGFTNEGGVGKLKINFQPKTKLTNRTWRIGKTDAQNKPISIIATVKDEEFEICTLTKSSKSPKVDKVEFTDDVAEDAKGRDLTINALYIELSKEDGENNKLFDPTGHGYHDLKNNKVKMNGNAKDKFESDPNTISRVLRLYAKYSDDDLDPDIEKSITDFTDDVDTDNLKDEFLKDLHSDANISKIVKIFNQTGMLNKLFPGLKINTDIPNEFVSKVDKPLALAWMLHKNPLEDVADVIVNSNLDKSDQRAILFLIALLEFSPEKRPDYLAAWKNTGLNKKQIESWTEFFNYKDNKGEIKNKRPAWSACVRTFAKCDKPLAQPDELASIPHMLLPHALNQLEIERFIDKIPKLHEEI